MPGTRLTRRERERRAYALTLASGGTGLATVVTFITALVGVTSFGLFFALMIVTVVLIALLRRTLRR
jgi:amino acid transporter